MNFLSAYIATAVVFFILDFIWLGFVAKNFYRSQLGDLMAEQVNMAVAAGFYAAYAAGIVIFAVSPALKSGEWRDALIYGALFGFFAYGTYDLTNIATLRDWPVAMSIVDMIWGTALTATSATLGFFITRALFTSVG